MSIKVCLDAGHYGKYNRSPAVPAYYESEMNWKLHLLLKKKLEEYGVEVITTRQDQTKDLGTINRGNLSKGCDLFLSIHSNAVGSGVNDKVDYPLAIIQMDRKGETLGRKLIKVIEEVMQTAQMGDMWTKQNSSGQEAYGVLRGCAAVGTMGMILEHSFHTCTRMATWLMDEKNLEKLATAEADVIAEYFGIQKPSAPAPVPKLKVGDVVTFTGNTHYTSEDAANGVPCKAGQATVTKIAEGNKHPYHLVKTGAVGPWGWVNASDIAELSPVEVAPPVEEKVEAPWVPAEGDIVKFVGSKHYTSPDGSYGYKCATGEAKITSTAKGQRHPYHLVRTGKTGPWGWVDADSFIKI